MKKIKFAMELLAGDAARELRVFSCAAPCACLAMRHNAPKIQEEAISTQKKESLQLGAIKKMAKQGFTHQGLPPAAAEKRATSVLFSASSRRNSRHFALLLEIAVNPRTAREGMAG